MVEEEGSPGPPEHSAPESPEKKKKKKKEKKDKKEKQEKSKAEKSSEKEKKVYDSSEVEGENSGEEAEDAGGGDGGKDDERRRPLGTEDDPIYTQWTEAQWRRYERVLGKHAKDIANKLGPHFDRVVKALGTQTESILDALGSEGTIEFARDVDKSIDHINRETDGLASKMKTGFDSLKSAIEGENGEDGPQLRATLEKIETAITKLERSQERYNQLLEEQTPEHLRLPNPERLAEKIAARAQRVIDRVESDNTYSAQEAANIRAKVESDWALYTSDNPEDRYRSKLYQQEVESWFEDRLREMETDERAFEEQGDIFRRVDLAVTYFQFRDETEHLGSKLAKRMEARRIMKRMTRVSNLSTPDNQMGQATSVKIEHFKELFTYKETDELNVFLEEMGMEEQEEDAVIAKEFEKYEDMGKRKQAGQLESDDIVDYYVTGGRLSTEDIQSFEDWNDETTIVEAISHLKKEKSKRRLESDEAELLSKLERELWAARTAGNLWSITHRAAHYDVFDERMNGTGGFFAARVMNLADRFEGKAGYQKTAAFWNHEFHGKLDLEFKDWFTLNKVYDLTAKNLSRDGLWAGDDRKMKEGYGPSQIDKFIKADATRKFFWGKNGFLQNPNHRSFKELGGLFGHLSDKDAIGKNARFGDENAVEVQEKFAEITERLMDWMYTPGAKELVENLKIFPSAEKVAWIEDASTEEMITNKQRDRLFNRYTSVPIPFMDPRQRAYMRARLSLYTAPFRDPMMRSLLISGNISELFKRLRDYIFADELRP